MRAGIFMKSANDPKFETALHKFSKGIYDTGDEFFVVNEPHYVNCDVAIFFGSWKDRNTPWHKTKKSIVQRTKRFIVMETPLLGRQAVGDIMPDDSYRIGVGGFLQDTGNFNNVNKPIDRWLKIKEKFNLSIEGWNDNLNGPIVIVMQLPGDASLKGCNISHWSWAIADFVRNKMNDQRHIIFRLPQLPREYDQKYIDRCSSIPNSEFIVGTYENKQPMLKEAYCTITYTSGMAVESVLAGTPTIACDPGNFAFPISATDIGQLNHLKRTSRQQWVQDLAYTQWSEDEIEIGEPWRHLKKIL